METKTALGSRVSILEDHQLVRDSLCSSLQDAGFDVVGKYGEPSAFLSRIDADQPEVAIIDLGLQDLQGTVLQDGLTVLKEVRQRHPELHTLVFSGRMAPPTVQDCYRIGASGYLDKVSASDDSVISTVRAIARGERCFPAHLLGETKGEPLPFDSPPIRSLSTRELEVLRYIVAGHDNLKIAAFLQISERTVKAHVTALYRKLGSENRTRLALAGLRLGVRPLPDA